MTIQLKQLVPRYLNSWYIPTVTTLATLAAFIITSIPRWNPFAALSGFLAIVLILSFLGILSASIWNFIKKRWVKGIINLLALPACGFVTISGTFMLMFGPSEDGFGKDIVIPSDMKVEMPLDSLAMTNSPANDTEGMALMTSFSTNNTIQRNREINIDLPVLNEFAGQGRNILFRHLASSAKWFVTKERGKVYAYRRCVVKGQWQNSLNGFYSASTFDTWGERFQFRIIIGPDGPVMSHPWKAKATEADITNHTIRLLADEDKRFSQGVESYLILKSKGAALEIFEQSQNPARPFTPLALQQINSELQSVLASPITQQRGFDPSLMPPESIKEGEPDIHIENGMQGGIYFVYAHVNPREPGYAYLKAFEATKNTPLSASRMPERSTEFLGWSDKTNEQFFYSSEITVYEGDWGIYYPARFELWFVPDSGKPQRKLIEKIFKIEGWQR